MSTTLRPGPRRRVAAAAAPWSAHRAWRCVVAMLIAALLPLAGIGAAAQAQQPPPVPAKAARITDTTGTLTAAQITRLDTELAALEAKTGAQVAILMVPTTQPETIEQFGIRVGDAWKLGRGRERAQRDTGDAKAGAIDDGLILLVAKNDRRVRIEVGYGLEGAIPDAVAKRIITEAITPRFRAGDFAGGLEAAVADLSRRIVGEDLPAPWQPGMADGGGRDADAIGGLLPTVLIAFIVGLFASRVAGRLIGAMIGGGGAGVTATAALASTGVGVAVGVGVGLLVLMMGGRGGGGGGGPLRRVGRRTIGHGPIFVPGGGWGGGGGFGGGGGGFSGGGGSFGGGGASGDW